MKKVLKKWGQSLKGTVPIFCIAILLSPPTSGSGHIASWYGGGEKLNSHTASGEVFSPETLTCASWDYPFDTHLKVTSLSTGKSVTVRVNDRGPAKRLGRSLDLTRRAFARIADVRQGLAAVRIEEIQ